MISINQLSKIYGWDESTIRKIWVNKGLDMSWPEERVHSWVIANILTPLRETNLREQTDREKLREQIAKAGKAELELQQQRSEVVDTSYLESSLSEYFSQLKNYLRTVSIPLKRTIHF
ncbi:hypothetical protein [uncultured Pantoea sp.]|uniref:hypothetical protein n=1 Tax=uncultured Pantoea sp. TaxID=218084 RepID=UPI002586FC5F|nr:hypothetical protein [uncultured Pantoea sp.]